MAGHNDVETGLATDGITLLPTEDGLAEGQEPSAIASLDLDGIDLDEESDILESVFLNVPELIVFRPTGDVLRDLEEGETVRLYLIEGVTPEIIEKCWNSDDTGISKLFRSHCLNHLASSPELGEYFFAKWPRLVHQTTQQWKVEARIKMGRPWNLESLMDPDNLCQNHERYEGVSRVYRPYAPLEPKPPELSGPPESVSRREDARDKGEGGTIGQRVLPKETHSVRNHGRYLVSGECVSCYFKRVCNGFIGFIIFDRPHRVKISIKRYQFGRDISRKSNTTFMPRFDGTEDSCNRFRKCLTNYLRNPEAASMFRESPLDVTKNILLHLILEDHVEILPRLHSALDYVDESMSDNKIIHKCLLEWRLFFGLWREVLWHDLNFIAYIRELLEHPINTEHSETLGWEKRYNFKTSFKGLHKKVELAQERVNSSFTAIMSTMSIVESQRAIVQAEEVSKLTKLAFFFIPLTLCAGIFGMNIVEWQNKLKVSHWVAISLAITVATYVVLYFGQIRVLFSCGPSYLENLDRNNLSRTIDNHVKLLMYFFRRYGMTILKVAAYLILSASMVVGIWEIVTKAHLPPDDRVKVGFGFAVALPAMLVIWLPLLHSSEVSPKRKWILVLILGVIVASVALGIWSIFRHAQYSTSKKISLSVFLAVFPPCFFSLCAPRLAIGDVFRRREEFDSRIDLCRAVWTFVSLAGIVWALTQKTQLSLADKIIDSFLIITFGGWLIFGLSSCLNDILLDNWHTQST